MAALVREAGPDYPLRKPGKCPRPRAFGGLALEYQITPFFMFLGCSPLVKIVDFFIVAFSTEA